MTSENENGNGSPTRRRFLAGLAATLGLVALAEVAWIALAFMKPRRRRRGAVGMVVAGPVDRFAPGSVTAFPEGRFYLARLKDGGFLALDGEQQDEAIREIESSISGDFANVQEVVYLAYYSQHQVHERIGWRTGPLQPLGFTLPPWDESILETVRKREPFWRQAPD